MPVVWVNGSRGNKWALGAGLLLIIGLVAAATLCGCTPPSVGMGITGLKESGDNQQKIFDKSQSNTRNWMKVALKKKLKEAKTPADTNKIIDAWTTAYDNVSKLDTQYLTWRFKGVVTGLDSLVAQQSVLALKFAEVKTDIENLFDKGEASSANLIKAASQPAVEDTFNEQN